MNAVNVITVGLPRMLRDILIVTIGQHTKNIMIKNYNSVNEFKASDIDGNPDIVLIENADVKYSELLYQYPKTKLFSIEGGGKSIDLWQLKPQKTALGEVSADRLVDYIAAQQGEA